MFLKFEDCLDHVLVEDLLDFCLSLGVFPSLVFGTDFDSVQSIVVYLDSLASAK